MYEMLAVASLMLRIMMFPHEGKVITIDQLTYSEKATSPTPDGVLRLVSQEVVTTYTKFSPGQFKPSSLLGTFPRDPPIIQEIVPSTGAPVCMMTSSNTTQTPKTVQETSTHATKEVKSLPSVITQTPFLYPPLVFVSQPSHRNNHVA